MKENKPVFAISTVPSKQNCDYFFSINFFPIYMSLYLLLKDIIVFSFLQPKDNYYNKDN